MIDNPSASLYYQISFIQYSLSNLVSKNPLLSFAFNVEPMQMRRPRYLQWRGRWSSSCKSHTFLYLWALAVPQSTVVLGPVRCPPPPGYHPGVSFRFVNNALKLKLRNATCQLRLLVRMECESLWGTNYYAVAAFLFIPMELSPPLDPPAWDLH